MTSLCLFVLWLHSRFIFCLIHDSLNIMCLLIFLHSSYSEFSKELVFACLFKCGKFKPLFFIEAVCPFSLFSFYGVLIMCILVHLSYESLKLSSHFHNFFCFPKSVILNELCLSCLILLLDQVCFWCFGWSFKFRYHSSQFMVFKNT